MRSGVKGWQKKMAKYVVPSPSTEIIIKCYRCKTLYVPEKKQFEGSAFFEDCPVCGCSGNDYDNRISLWRYNLIKFWRGLFK